jgi:hypothetical protein
LKAGLTVREQLGSARNEFAAFKGQTDDLLGDFVQDVRVDLVRHR